MNEWPATVWASVSAMTAAMVLSLILLLGSMARETSNIQQQEDTNIAILKERRFYSQYDGTKGLFPQDIVTAIGESKGYPEIWVDTLEGAGDNFTLKWGTSTIPANFATNIIISTLPKTGLFNSDLVKDANGSIGRIEFRRQ